ncbi:MAG: hypothetical protein OXU69_09245 [Gemmatimonadota bacterium]|nr:hypothetical protein [Gemmatimonadota bacterium]MDE2984877.1 hypothetical protein [Gemmatimonadota bacterium]
MRGGIEGGGERWWAALGEARAAADTGGRADAVEGVGADVTEAGNDP